jgi:hypothetical protein
VLHTYGGRLSTLRASTRLARGAHFGLDMGFSRHRVMMPRGSFVADVAALRAVYAFSIRLVATALLQRNSLDGTLVTNLRLNFIHRPGRDLFVVFNEEWGDAAPRRRVTGHGLAVKLTYLARF